MVDWMNMYSQYMHHLNGTLYTTDCVNVSLYSFSGYYFAEIQKNRVLLPLYFVMKLLEI